MKSDYISKLQVRTAKLAVGASTLRSQGACGMVECARNYLKTVNLKILKSVTSERQFQSFLNRHTKVLSLRFPEGGKGNWGAARKCMNIFLRDCLYNVYLAEAYRLKDIENWLEVPLDGDVGRQLHSRRKTLQGRWETIKHLTPERSKQYQAAALNLSKTMDMARVHLDVEFWSGNW